MHSFGEELRKKKDTKKMEECTTIKQGNVSYFVYSHPRWNKLSYTINQELGFFYPIMEAPYRCSAFQNYIQKLRWKYWQ